ncbi:MAG: hypothetical protein AAFV88_17255 [Planctomycetota bacterium]
MMNKQSLSALVRRAEDRDHFVASQLAQFREIQKIDNSGVAEYLRCDSDQLLRLAMCFAPTPKDDFPSHVQKLASFAGCDAGQLALLIRKCDAVRIATRRVAEDGSRYSLAARDQKEGVESDDDSGDGVSQ